MFNVAHVQHHQDTCVNATNATLKHENKKTWHLRETPRRKTKDTEANMLSRITRKSNVRSTFCWFIESCKSQCLSLFAAPFIVGRVETSITGSYVVHTTASHQRKWQMIRWWKLLSRKWQANFADRNQQSHFPAMAMHVDAWTSCTWPQRHVHKHDIGMCEWPLRRFTYGNFVTTPLSSVMRFTRLRKTCSAKQNKSISELFTESLNR